MAKFRYIGDPAEGGAGPQKIEMYGYMFGRKEFTEVPETPANADAIRRLTNHHHFERDGVKRAPDDHGAVASAVQAGAAHVANQERQTAVERRDRENATRDEANRLAAERAKGK